MVITLRIIVIAFIGAALGACSKTSEPTPKTAEQRAAEKTSNDKSVRDNAVWGTQVQALDKAKDVQKAADQQAEDTRKKIETYP
jgi:hypothetical protein